MARQKTILILSDIHYACDAERQRRGHETRVIANPLLRRAVRAYRYYIWLRDPFAHNHLLDEFLRRADSPDWVVTNGDYSCDTAFVGVADPAAFESARQCLTKLRDRFGAKLRSVIGDHELGKTSLFGGKGGLRLASWRRATTELGLQPLWEIEIGNYVLIGVTSSLLAYPVYEPEGLPTERTAWNELREAHLNGIRRALATLRPAQRVLLFCHDPTALPFLWQEETIRRKLPQIEHTIIGHLHSTFYFQQSQWLAGMPVIRFLGNSIRRMTEALNDARCWRDFKVRLCPAMAGIEGWRVVSSLSIQRNMLNPFEKTVVRRKATVSGCLNVFSAPTRCAAGARDLSRRNVSTAQTRPHKFQRLLRSPTPLRTEVRAPSLARRPG